MLLIFKQFKLEEISLIEYNYRIQNKNKAPRMNISILNDILDFIDLPYRVSEEIADSGQRKVFEGYKVGDPKRLVIKISPIFATAVARIQREIKILNSLNSDYFPKIIFQCFITDQNLEDFYDNQDPQRDLNKFLEIKDLEIKPFLLTIEEYIINLPWDECLEKLRIEKNLVIFLLHLFKGLSLLWEKKVVHRDLKPENILIRPSFIPIIIDLGIAKSFQEGTPSLTHPAFNSPCTPRYAAPEQLTNDKSEITYKTDQFSIGVIAFYILTNQFPYGDEKAVGIEQTINNLLKGIAPNIKSLNKNINDKLSNLVNKLIAVKPYERFRTPNKIIKTLMEIKEEIR